MANTYTQICIHAIYAVKYRQAMIDREWRERLNGYVTGIVKLTDNKMLVVNNEPDHIHMVMAIRPTCQLSDLVQRIKASSSKWINESGLCNHRFEWQEGFAGFSVSPSQLETLIHYVETQEEHHRKRTFEEEYRGFLNENNLGFNERFIFRGPI